MKIYKSKEKLFKLLSLVIVFVLSGWQIIFADTIIFTEGCASAVGSSLATSTTISVGTSWSSRITLTGSPTSLNYITAGNTVCSTNANATNIGYGYTMTPNSSLNEYYADWSNIDGNPATDDGSGVLLNYIDSSNYYACILNDDANMDAYILKVRAGVGSTVGSSVNMAVTPATGNVIRCQIDYTGSIPVLSFINSTSGVILVASTTDPTNPLTRTNKAGFYCGATPASTGHDCGTGADADTIRLVEVTVSAVPRTTTSAATGVGVVSAALNGVVSDSNSAAATEVGYAWGITSGLTTDVATTSLTGTYGTGDTFSRTVSGLVAGKQYFFRAYATNSSGTGYGTILNFTATTDITTTRKMRLFEGSTIKFYEGTIKLYGN